jgi:hypothetical protein
MPTEPTPRPWYCKGNAVYWFPEGRTVLEGYRHVASTHSYDATTDPIDEGTDEANASLIVRAVNSHDELIAACEQAAGYLEHERDAGWPEVLACLRSALARAKE